MLIVYVLLGLVLIRVLFVGAALLLVVRRVNACPACFAATLPVRPAWLWPVRAHFELRWCPACSWQGLSRTAGRISGHEHLSGVIEHG